MSDKFHVYDPGFGGNCIIAVCDNIDEAIRTADEAIKDGWTPDQGDEWSGDVECVAVYLAPADCSEPDEDGELVAQASIVDRVDRPDDVDEDGYSDSTGLWWGHGSDFICNYRVLPIKQEPVPS